MIENKFVRSFIGVFLLLVFTCTITPRLYLHHALANHTDEQVSIQDPQQQQITISGFHCQVYDHVCTEPSIITKQVIFVAPFIKNNSLLSCDILTHYKSAFVYKNLRGPPRVG